MFSEKDEYIKQTLKDNNSSLVDNIEKSMDSYIATYFKKYAL